jgi:glycine oxidase
LVAGFRRAGGTLRARVEVAELVCGAGAARRVRGVRLAGGELLPAAQVVVAAGPWSAQLPGLPGHARIPIRPVKGQILRLRDLGGPGLLTRVLRMQPGYVVPRGDGRYVLGASVEERGFDTTVTAGPVFELLRDAIELLPGLSELVIEELSAGIRPGTPDNKPLLGPGAVPGLHWATGHYRHGILLAPITAEILASALIGEEPTELARECAPDRFGPVTAGTSGRVTVGT